MPRESAEPEIVLCHEDAAVVREALARGEVDAIFPAVAGFVDRFHDFLQSVGFLSLLEQLPDRRQRKSVPAFFYGNVLLHKEILGLKSFANVGEVLFQSPAVLRSLGFNFRAMHQGFYQNGEIKPFNQEALCDYFAGVDPVELLAHQEQVAKHLWDCFPGLRQSRVAMMDCVDVKVRRCRPPNGTTSETVHYKFCVLALYAEGTLFPVLWNYTEDQDAGDVTLGRQLLETAFRVFGSTPFDYLVVDRGYVDGAWMATLKDEHQVDTVIRLREDMRLYNHLLARRNTPDRPWRPADPPKLRDQEIPTREIAGFDCAAGFWDAFPHPLRACLIQDTYSDRTVYQAVVTTALDQDVEGTHQLHRSRWEIEEGFMTLSRYWQLNAIGPCRPLVGFCQAHFTFLAYILMNLFRRFEAQQQREVLKPQLTAGEEVVVYWRDSYALFLPSQLIALILENIDYWLARKDKILKALRHAEGREREPP